MTDKEEALNLKVLRRTSGSQFQEVLEKAPSLLKPRQAPLFFKTVLSHFAKDDIPQETGDLVLLSITRCIGASDILKCFMSGNFFSMLPIKKPRFQNGIFTLFHALIVSSPELVDEAVAACFLSLISADPKKSLTLIAIYCQHFNEIDNPWPLVDLLIQEGNSFNTPDLAPDYISVLAFMNKKYIEYRNGRAQHCWNQVTSMLLSTDITTLRCCYGGLCAIADGFSGGPLPLDLISSHMKQMDLQECVLSLLNVASLSEKDASNRKLISTLMEVAENNVKATIVLMKLGCFLSSAQTIFSIKGWINKKLPTMIDTLRFFLVLLKHKELREKIADSNDFIDFLKNIIGIDKGGMIPIACTIIRRIPITKEFVTNLSKSGFLQKFYGAEESEDDDGLTQHSKLLLTDTICRATYVKDFLTICDKISIIISENGEFADAASLVATRLCKYSKCKARMKEMKLDSFFKKNRNDPKFKSISKKFLHAIET